jgi:hypothetical protein
MYEPRPNGLARLGDMLGRDGINGKRYCRLLLTLGHIVGSGRIDDDIRLQFAGNEMSQSFFVRDIKLDGRLVKVGLKQVRVGKSSGHIDPELTGRPDEKSSHESLSFVT